MAKLNKRILRGLKVNEIYSRKIYEQTSSDFSYFVSVSPGLPVFVISSHPLPFMSLQGYGVCSSSLSYHHR